MNHEEHKKVVEREKEIVDRAGKKIASSIISGLSLKLLLSDKLKRYMIIKALTASDKYFTEVSKLGHEFAQRKIDDKLQAVS